MLMWIVECIFDFLMGNVGYATARLVLPLLSFRRVYAEPLTSPPKRFNALGYRRDEDGRIEIEEMVAGFMGLVILAIAFSIGGLLFRLAA